MTDYRPPLEQVVALVNSHRPLLELRSVKHVAIDTLGAGEQNWNFLITVNGDRRFNLRIGKRGDESNDWLAREIAALNLAPAAMGPRLYARDFSRRLLPHPYLILEYIPGRSKWYWRERDIRAHAYQLARLHDSRQFAGHGDVRSDADRLTPIFDFSHKFEGALAYWHANHPDLFERRATADLQSPIRRFIARHNHLYRERSQFVLLHGDPHPCNILFHDGHIRYIDWEWASIGDPAGDIAQLGWDVTTPWQRQLTATRLQIFLDAYQEQRPDPSLATRRDVWMIYTMFTNYLYHRTQQAHDDRHKRAAHVLESYLSCRFI